MITLTELKSKLSKSTSTKLNEVVEDFKEGYLKIINEFSEKKFNDFENDILKLDIDAKSINKILQEVKKLSERVNEIYLNLPQEDLEHEKLIRLFVTETTKLYDLYAGRCFNK